MCLRLLALVCTLVLGHGIGAQDVEKKKLRGLIALPTVTLEFGLGVNGEGELTLVGDETDLPAEILALEKEIRGNDGDADRYCRLAWLYEDEARSRQAANKAIELASRQAQRDPRNGRLLMQLGEALLAAKKDAEGERTLRQAVKLAPQDAECWLALAGCLYRQVTTALFGARKGNVTVNDLLKLAAGKQAAETRARCRKLVEEARGCLDQAATIAPRNAKCYLARASFHIMTGVLYLLGDGEQGGDNPLQRMYSVKVVNDLNKAAELSPDDSRAQTIAGLAELYWSLLNLDPNDVKENVAVADAFPAKSKKAIAAVMSRLAVLSEKTNKKAACEACYGMALIDFIMGREDGKCECWLRRAVALQPGHDPSWDLLVIALAANKKVEARVCEERLRIKDNGHNRYVAAKTYMVEDQFEPAEKHLQAALRWQPDDARAHLALAALFLKRSHKDDLAQAGKHLARAESLLAKYKAAELDEYAVLYRGFYAALSGDSEAARRRLKNLLDKGAKNETAEKMLRILGN